MWRRSTLIKTKRLLYAKKMMRKKIKMMERIYILKKAEKFVVVIEYLKFFPFFFSFFFNHNEIVPMDSIIVLKKNSFIITDNGKWIYAKRSKSGSMATNVFCILLLVFVVRLR
jgi:hypothetical protein